MLISLSSQGVLRIHFLEAQDLLAKDVFLGGIIKGKSDPYGVLHIGNQLFRSKVIKKTVNPKWHEVYEVERTFLNVHKVVQEDFLR
jgi:Ca2+-dependent lipid-binding protein